MKKLILSIILVISLALVGCNNTSSTSEVNSNSSYESSQGEKNQNIERKEVDISSMKGIIEDILKSMDVNHITYNQCRSKKYLPQVTYFIINNNYFRESNIELDYEETGLYVALNKNIVDKYLKATFYSFNGEIVDSYLHEMDSSWTMMEYLSRYDAYGISPADGDGWVEVNILEAYDNLDGTYEATVDATMMYNDDSEYMGKYKVFLAKNEDLSSKFKYRITNIIQI